VDFNASAYVKGGRFFILGLSDSDRGPIPFAWHCDCDAPDGPVNIGAEGLNPNIEAALDEAHEAITSKVEIERMRLVAAELVDRARDGDQNAMALLQRVGENARKGVPRAQVAFSLCQEYMNTHGPNTFGAERTQVRGLLGTVSNAIKVRKEPLEYSTALHALLPGILTIVDPSDAAVIIANGPQLYGKDNARLTAILAAFPTEDERKAFTAGASTDHVNIALQKVSHPLKPACAIGYIVGLARRIQLVRLPETPISAFSKDVAWELGD
jgi:hypothetical protein